jgi:formylglycine-generating enzyme required for sulfatase activity
LLYLSGAFGGGSNVNSGGNTNATANTNTGANANVVANANAVPGNANAGGQGTEQRTRPDLVSLDGGSFRVGLSDVPPLDGELKNTRPTYLLWLYAQWPAHAVTVKPFQMDRTEVTNAEYAEFVKETGHEPPPDIWDGDRPRAGEEKLPVSNVTFEDARAFAEWRSKRDGVAYRLPTEEEWEYAARGGDPARVYPWGGAWVEGNANMGTDGARPVGSFPRGRTPQGVEDMIGNVWEWTSSMATMYRGNSRTTLGDADRENVVVRGGSYKSRPDGDQPVTASARRWYARDFRDPVLGFRLVRADY